MNITRCVPDGTIGCPSAGESPAQTKLVPEQSLKNLVKDKGEKTNVQLKGLTPKRTCLRACKQEKPPAKSKRRIGFEPS